MLLLLLQQWLGVLVLVFVMCSGHNNPRQPMHSSNLSISISNSA